MPHVAIRRLVVEEGFLDGLDIAFEDGLNVIIGPRGVGKTSVIQLLRFGLGLSAHNDAFDTAARKHARDVLLPDGRVSILLDVDGEEIAISRRRDDDRPEGLMVNLPLPIILAQTEVEDIAIDPSGRLRLLDGFRAGVNRDVSRERAIRSAIASLSLELRDLEAQVEASREQVAHLHEEISSLAAAEAEVATTTASEQGVAQALAKLDALGKTIASVRAETNVLENAHGHEIPAWIAQLESSLRAVPSLERWPSTEEDPLATARESVARVAQVVEDGTATLRGALAEINTALQDRRERARALDDEARQLRRIAEELQAGAGATARKVALLREKRAQLGAVAAALEDRRARYTSSKNSRDEALDELGALRDARFQKRGNVAADLNLALGPRVRVGVRRSGLFGPYAAAISETLRGSGLHYSELAPQLAARLSPEELIQAVEHGNAEIVASAARIPGDRARRVIDRFREVGPVQVIEAGVEDAVDLQLLDGADYKDSEHLSTGQRCTVVLPIVMSHDERTIVLDQPEDHLDGAFIVDTLVRAIELRGSSQLITSTHNANIPVLGNASRVFVFESDGRRGFTRHVGGLDDARTVDAITSLMEGGREAFARRAAFYNTKP